MRSTAIKQLVADLEEFRLDLNHYYDDLEPQGVYDSVLSGKIDALVSFCNVLGWAQLSSILKETQPLRGNAVEALAQIQGFVLPEIRQLMSEINVDSPPNQTQIYWDLLHPRATALARPRFDAGFFGDAVESCFKEVNDRVKAIVRDLTGKELDGAGLMTLALSPGNPIIKLNALATESDRNMQQGYMQIFAGAMTGIRNPKAHGNLSPPPKDALHLIGLASWLLMKIDERVA